METVDREKFKMQTYISIIILTLGILVMIYGIVVEDEPTAVALFLILTGSVWLFITRLRIRSKQKLNQQNISK